MQPPSPTIIRGLRFMLTSLAGPMVGYNSILCPYHQTCSVLILLSWMRPKDAFEWWNLITIPSELVNINETMQLCITEKWKELWATKLMYPVLKLPKFIFKFVGSKATNHFSGIWSKYSVSMLRIVELQMRASPVGWMSYIKFSKWLSKLVLLLSPFSLFPVVHRFRDSTLHGALYITYIDSHIFFFHCRINLGKIWMPESKFSVLLDYFYLLWLLKTVIKVTIPHD